MFERVTDDFPLGGSGFEVPHVGTMQRNLPESVLQQQAL